jgi:XXXCH domain-containing protein
MDKNIETINSDKQSPLKKSNPRKKMISSYMAIQESMQAGLKPPSVLFDTFMREVDLLVTYKKFGKTFNKEVSVICSKFERAFADNELDRLVELYEELEELKIKAAFFPA